MFALSCRAGNPPYLQYRKIILDICMHATAPMTHHIQDGKDNAGTILMIAAATKSRSAMLSIAAPDLLSAPSLLANGPSIISEIPHQTYNAQNGRLNAVVNRIAIAATPLEMDIRLGK